MNWHDDHQNFWDTHGDNFNQLKNRLMPPADQGLSALLDRPGRRAGCSMRRWSSGLADSAASRHITRGNAGREHWPHCYTPSWPARDSRRGRLRCLRPMGGLSVARPGQPRRYRRDDHPPHPRHRPRDRDPRPYRAPLADQQRKTVVDVVRVGMGERGRFTDRAEVRRISQGGRGHADGGGVLREATDDRNRRLGRGSCRFAP